MPGDLHTTNILLGIMAAVSGLEAIAIIALGIAAAAMYRRVMDLVNGLEARHVMPAVARFNAVLDDLSLILDDVKVVTATVKDETERVDTAIHRTMDRIDDSANRVRRTVWSKTSVALGVVRGVRSVIEAMLRSEVRT
jgi:methyl-accepting chemotaxis protein